MTIFRLFALRRPTLRRHLRSTVAYFTVVVAATALVPTAATPEDVYGARTELNFYGLPGLIDMPSADMMPDGEIATTISGFAGMTRGTFSFQVAPRLVGSFRYSGLENWDAGGFDTYYDRSFDLRFQLLTESERRPSITIGLQDFIGTGLYSAEFVAATKTFADRFSVTAGVGWGRLGSGDPFGSTGTRPATTSDSIGNGGTPNSDQWFRGDVAAFGGVAWRPTPELTLKAEYSSDAYVVEDDARGIFNRATPFNFGVEYQVSRDFRVGAYSLYGTEVGLSFQLALNPARPPNPGSLDPAPVPVLQRPSRASAPQYYTTDWTASRETRVEIRDELAAALLEDGIEMEALDLEAESATVYIRNARYNFTPQALGRTARHLSRMMPSSIETFSIVQMSEGMALPAIEFRRSDVETYETRPDGAERMRGLRSVDSDPPTADASDRVPGIYPRFTWNIGPDVQTSLFDPDNPLRADLNLKLNARYTLAPGLLVGGSVEKKLVGNLDRNKRDSNSTLPRVRSDFPEYDKYGDPNISTLYGAYYFQPGEDLYGRVTLGLLERMHGGISTELLWAPYDSRVALGAELNYTQQRDFDGGFGFQDYNVATGSAAVYWQVTDDYSAQLNMGRYLAGDYGATLALERVFANGWTVGAFATKTDVSAEDFGEGSFDKGITVTVPLNWLVGKSTRISQSFGVNPLTRDAGAPLSVPGRLYPKIEEGRRYQQDTQWGEFWR